MLTLGDFDTHFCSDNLLPLVSLPFEHFRHRGLSLIDLGDMKIYFVGHTCITPRDEFPTQLQPACTFHLYRKLSARPYISLFTLCRHSLQKQKKIAY